MNPTAMNSKKPKFISILPAFVLLFSTSVNAKEIINPFPACKAATQASEPARGSSEFQQKVDTQLVKNIERCSQTNDSIFQCLQDEKSCSKANNKLLHELWLASNQIAPQVQEDQLILNYIKSGVRCRWLAEKRPTFSRLEADLAEKLDHDYALFVQAKTNYRSCKLAAGEADADNQTNCDAFVKGLRTFSEQRLMQNINAYPIVKILMDRNADLTNLKVFKSEILKVLPILKANGKRKLAQTYKEIAYNQRDSRLNEFQLRRRLDTMQDLFKSPENIQYCSEAVSYFNKKGQQISNFNHAKMGAGIVTGLCSAFAPGPVGAMCMYGSMALSVDSEVRIVSQVMNEVGGAAFCLKDRKVTYDKQAAKLLKSHLKSKLISYAVGNIIPSNEYFEVASYAWEAMKITKDLRGPSVKKTLQAKINEGIIFPTFSDYVKHFDSYVNEKVCMASVAGTPAETLKQP